MANYSKTPGRQERANAARRARAKNGRLMNQSERPLWTKSKRCSTESCKNVARMNSTICWTCDAKQGAKP